MKPLALLACFAVACGSPAKPTKGGARQPVGQTAKPAAAPNELYDRLGGQRAIVAVVDDFIARVAADGRIKLRFANTDIGKLKLLLVEFVCMATGGPCRYTGRDMETSHAGMELVDEEFTALVEDLAATLAKFKVPAKEQAALLGALGPLQPRIVTPRDRLKPVAEPLLAKASSVADKLSDPATRELMQAAIVAARRGQRNWADQLFSRVELAPGVDAQAVAAAAPAFRTGAPPRIDSPLKQLPLDTPAQPKIAGSSDEDSAPGPQLPGSLRGTITVDGKPLDGVGLVQLYPESGRRKKRTAKPHIVEQRNKTFSPRLLAVAPGSTVAFPNFDSFYHNVFSISPTQPFDLGLFKEGKSREMKLDKKGLIRLGCNVHANMASFIFVIDAPHYVPVDGAKEFVFKSLEPGKYKALVWSERSADPLETEIKIKDGVNTMTFDVKGDAERGPSPDKFGTSRRPNP